MSDVRVDLDRAELRRLYSTGGQVWVFVSGVTRRILTRAKLYAPVRTGYLRNSGTAAMEGSSGDSVTGMVGFSATYAMAVHEGVQRRVITAKPGGVLAFNVNGRKVYARSVVQPARKGQPFLQRATDEELARLT